MIYTVNLDVKNGIAVDWSATQNRAAVLAAMPSGENVTQESPNVNYSISPEQEAFFKDFKVRDENGNLKVMYHDEPRGISFGVKIPRLPDKL